MASRLLKYDHVLCNYVRRLEDKLIHHNLEIRQFVVVPDMAHVHANAAAPEAYVNLLAVSDVTLPAKGTGHRASKITEKDFWLQ